MPEQSSLLEYEVQPVPTSMSLLDFIRTRGMVQVHEGHTKVTCPKCGGLNIVEGTSNFPNLTCCKIVVRIQND